MPPIKGKANKKGRDCTVCDVFKTWPNFSKSRNKSHRFGHVTECKQCACRRHAETRDRGKGDVDISALAHARIKSKNEWTYAQVNSLACGLLKEFGKDNYDLKAIFEKYGRGRKLGACKAIYVELKKAAQAKLTLKQYWDGGRKFSYGKKELVSETKK